MSKIIFLVVAIAAIATRIQAEDDDDTFPHVPNFFTPGFTSFGDMPEFPEINVLTPDEIKNMKPADGNSVVSGTSVSSSSSIETINGVPVKKTSGGRVVTNNNGKVSDISYGN